MANAYNKRSRSSMGYMIPVVKPKEPKTAKAAADEDAGAHEPMTAGGGGAGGAALPKIVAPSSHRSHPLAKPAANTLLQQKWDRLYYESHRQKVHQARPFVDTQTPKPLMHIHVKLRKIQKEEERLQEVEKDNRFLLERMSRIMKTKGAVDNTNDYEHLSMHKGARQRELQRICIDNQHLLRRIQIVAPVLKPKAWEKDFAVSQTRRMSMSRFPPPRLSMTSNPRQSFAGPYGSRMHSRMASLTIEESDGNEEAA